MVLQGNRIRETIGEEACDKAEKTCKIWKKYIDPMEGNPPIKEQYESGT